MFLTISICSFAGAGLIVSTFAILCMPERPMAERERQS